MSQELLRELRTLEGDYAGQPLVAQRADLVAINRIRDRLGMRLVDAGLREIGAPVEPPKPAPPPAACDHTAARDIYQAYLKKLEELEPHRAYADQVARATAGGGQTPVRPLATMGTGGGPLLCDHCGKPIVLEGGDFQGVNADVAWRQKGGDWRSWISGGMVVEIVLNGTLRIYHGYPGRDNAHCCNVARRQDEKAEAEFEPRKSAETFDILLAFFAEEFATLSEKERWALANEVVNTLYSYDPGIGVNRPSPPG